MFWHSAAPRRRGQRRAFGRWARRGEARQRAGARRGVPCAQGPPPVPALSGAVRQHGAGQPTVQAVPDTGGGYEPDDAELVKGHERTAFRVSDCLADSAYRLFDVGGQIYVAPPIAKFPDAFE